MLVEKAKSKTETTQIEVSDGGIVLQGCCEASDAVHAEAADCKQGLTIRADCIPLLEHTSTSHMQQCS